MIRGPTETDRTVVLGSTGSGKSQFAIALLSTRNFDEIPWFFLDYKGEDLMEEILEATGSTTKEDPFNRGPIPRISVHDDPPKKPGLYYVKVKPLVDDLAVEIFLQKIYNRASNGAKRIGSGIFLDEGFALPRNSKFFDVLLTQGRSIGCPIIVLYQRPVHMSRFAITQASFIATFRLQDMKDKARVSEYTAPAIGDDGKKITAFDTLAPYHCLWYDIGRGTSTVLTPAPDRQSIINLFKRRLSRDKIRALI